MADKRYYWIKLPESFFQKEEIDYILNEENGFAYVILFQKLCLLTANKNGELVSKFGDTVIPFDNQKISRDTKMPLDIVEKGIDIFKFAGLIIDDNGIPTIPYVLEIVGSESASAQRVRKHREKQALQNDENVISEVLQSNEEKDNRDRDKIKDIKEKDAQKKEKGENEREREKYNTQNNFNGMSNPQIELAKMLYPDNWQDMVSKLSNSTT